MSGERPDDDPYDWLSDRSKTPRPAEAADERPLPVGDWRTGAPEHRLRRAAAIVAGLALLAGLASYGYEQVTDHDAAVQTQQTPDKPAISTLPPTRSPVATKSPSVSATPKPPTAAECIAKLPLSLEIGQKLMFGATAATLPGMTTLAARYNIGGVILMDQVPAKVEHDFASAQPLPPLVATDQEGGTVQRYKTEGLLPAAADVPAEWTPAQIQARIKTDDVYLRSQGINMNLAPVVDVAPISGSSVLGSRIFSSDPAIVTKYARAYLEAGDSTGILSAIKHFPGLGSATGNTDYGTATTPDLNQLRLRDLPPYQQLAQLGNVAVMVGNQTVPGLTGGLPASLSHAAISDLLRSQLGYQNNVVITDSLSAAAITSRYGIGDAVVKSWEAGSDIALVVTLPAGVTLRQEIDHITAVAHTAIDSGQLRRADVDASVARLFGLQQKMVDPCTILPNKQP